MIFNTGNPAYTCSESGGSYTDYSCSNECAEDENDLEDCLSFGNWVEGERERACLDCVDKFIAERAQLARQQPFGAAVRTQPQQQPSPATCDINPSLPDSHLVRSVHESCPIEADAEGKLSAPSG